MIVYLDTSSLVKLYKDETESAEVERLVSSAEVAATSRLAYVECRAAFAQAQRLSALGQAPPLRGRRSTRVDTAYRDIVSSFMDDWTSKRFYAWSVSASVIGNAGDLAERHALRGYDAVHVASALSLARRLESDFLFSSFDPSQRRAAAAEGLSLAHEVTS